MSQIIWANCIKPNHCPVSGPNVPTTIMLLSKIWTKHGKKLGKIKARGRKLIFILAHVEAYVNHVKNTR